MGGSGTGVRMKQGGAAMSERRAPCEVDGPLGVMSSIV